MNSWWLTLCSSLKLNRTDLYLHFVNPKDDSIMEVNSVLTLIDKNLEYLVELYKEFNVLLSEVWSTTRFSFIRTLIFIQREIWWITIPHQLSSFFCYFPWFTWIDLIWFIIIRFPTSFISLTMIVFLFRFGIPFSRSAPSHSPSWTCHRVTYGSTLQLSIIYGRKSLMDLLYPFHSVSEDWSEIMEKLGETFFTQIPLLWSSRRTLNENQKPRGADWWKDKVFDHYFLAIILFFRLR